MKSSVTFPQKFQDKIDRLASASSRLSELAPQIEQILEEDNRTGLLAGSDRNGAPLAPLAQSTRKNRHRGPGGPLVPDGSSSRLITGYQVTVQQVTNGLKIVGSWPGISFVKHIVSGGKHTPARDINGVRPASKEKLLDVLKQFYRDQLKS
jgi:hypothetical protein